MGSYFNPPESSALIEAGGIVLSYHTTLKPKELFDSLVKQLPPNHVLIGHYDRGIFKNAVNLYSFQEFMAFHKQVLDGQILCIDYYALPSNKL